MTRLCLSSLKRILRKVSVVASVAAALSCPVFAQAIATSNLGVNQVTLGLTASTTGTGWLTVLASGASCGSAAQTVNGQDSTGGAAFRRGSLPLTAGIAGSYTVRNLVQTTPYKVCFTPDGTTAPSSVTFTTTAATTFAGKDWGPVGGAGFSTGIVDNPLLAIAPDGSPYVAYVANDTRMPVVMRYTGGSWQALTGGVAFSSTGLYYLSLAFSPDGTPYVAYADLNNASRETVVRYSGGAWVLVGSAGFSSGTATNTSLAFAPDGTPYVAYIDEGPGNNPGAATVMRFTGGSWSPVGSPQFTPFLALYPSLAIAADGTPYLAFGDGSIPSGAVTVMSYSAGAWTVVGTPGFSISTAELLSLGFAPDGTPTVAYEDDGNSRKETVMQFRAGSWSALGSAGFSVGRVDQSSLAFAADGTPIVAYLDAESGNYDTGRVLRYSGGTWTPVGSALSSPNSASYLWVAVGSDGTPYVVYEDRNNKGKATVEDLQLPASSLSVTPSSIQFPSTSLGTVSAIQTATVSNSGSSAVYLTSPALTDTTDFTASDNCGGIVVANGSCTVSFTFTPQSAGALSSTYTIADRNNPASPLAVTLSGTGTGSYGLTISPGVIGFPATNVGSTSSPMTATLTLHGGSTRVSLTAGSLTDATDFSQSDNCNGNITPNGSCTVTFTFAPKSTGTLNSTYTIALQGSGAPVTVTLSGTGTGAPQASLSPASLSFVTTVGLQAASQTVTLSNPGNLPLTIGSIGLTGNNASLFSIGSSTCTSSLASGGSCTIPVSCVATAYGSYNAALTLTGNATPATQSVPLSCAVNGTAAATLTPASSDFGSVTVGTSTSATAFKLSNTGNIPLNISSITLTGNNPSSFNIVANSCGSSLPVSASCMIGILFSPATAGSFMANLNVVDGAGAHTSVLAGSAVPLVPPDFTIAASPATQATYRGTAVAYTIGLQSVSAANPFTGAVALSATGLPQGATAAFSSASATPGGSTPSSITMTVTVPAVRSAAIGFFERRTAWIALLPLLSMMALWRRRRHSSQRIFQLFLIVAALGAAAGMSGCGSNSTGFAIPVSTSTITVTGTAASASHSTTVTLVIN